MQNNELFRSRDEVTKDIVNRAITRIALSWFCQAGQEAAIGARYTSDKVILLYYCHYNI